MKDLIFVIQDELHASQLTFKEIAENTVCQLRMSS